VERSPSVRGFPALDLSYVIVYSLRGIIEAIYEVRYYAKDSDVDRAGAEQTT
jgi:hypothetical protein